ncbi:hypothetical protein [Stenotrophomonas sp. STK17_22]|uniref:hypothetical protein n=1 Tax=Stenotrophomonas sp. STK17_22 TaxID=3455201 RepID=UPI003F81DA6E
MSSTQQRIRDTLAWYLLLERGATRRARHFEALADNPCNPNRAASARVATGYRADAAKDRRRVAELRSELAAAVNTSPQVREERACTHDPS